MRYFLATMTLAAACGGGAPAPPSQCDLTNATPIVHATLAGSETWDSGVHRVPSSLTVEAGATLTVAACSRVELGADVGITINGHLVVAGTADGPVSFVSLAAPAPWGALQLNPNPDARAELSYTTLTGGGGAAPLATSAVLGAPIYVHGAGGPPPPTPLKLTHVDIEQPTGVGVALVNAGFADGSTGLVVHGAGSYAVYLGADVVDTLPDGTYSGNSPDAIALQTAITAGQANARTITRDLTIHDRGVPYCVGIKEPGEIVIGGPSVPLVTIEPGVVIGFPKGSTSGGRLRILGDGAANPTQALGALAAVGTQDKPIVFTSCEATANPGDWIGLTLVGVDARTRFEFVGIGNAGADSGVIGTCLNSVNTRDADAALQIEFQQGGPTASFMVNSLISGSAGNGIHRGWSGDDVDFLAGNTLNMIAWCAETLVPDLSNACPNTQCPTAP